MTGPGDDPKEFLLRLADSMIEAEKTGWADRVEEAWARWVNSTTGQVCLDPDPIFTDAATPLQMHLNYRLRAAFVAGWIAKENAVELSKCQQNFVKENYGEDKP